MQKRAFFLWCLLSSIGFQNCAGLIPALLQPEVFQIFLQQKLVYSKAQAAHAMQTAKNLAELLEVKLEATFSLRDFFEKMAEALRIKNDAVFRKVFKLLLFSGSQEACAKESCWNCKASARQLLEKIKRIKFLILTLQQTQTKPLKIRSLVLACLAILSFYSLAIKGLLLPLLMLALKSLAGLLLALLLFFGIKPGNPPDDSGFCHRCRTSAHRENLTRLHARLVEPCPINSAELQGLDARLATLNREMHGLSGRAEAVQAQLAFLQAQAEQRHALEAAALDAARAERAALEAQAARDAAASAPLFTPEEPSRRANEAAGSAIMAFLTVAAGAAAWMGGVPAFAF